MTVGHGVILHACTVEDNCLIGMGSIILDGAVIGQGSVVGAGALITKGTVIPPNSLVLGSPAKVVKDLGGNPRIITASGRRNTSRWLPGIRSESSIPVFNI